VSLKSTGHHNTGTRLEEVEEEPMVMTRVQDGSGFFPTVVFTPMWKQQDESFRKGATEPNTVVQISLLFFTQQQKTELLFRSEPNQKSTWSQAEPAIERAEPIRNRSGQLTSAPS
jgi:hypothetical protein